MEFDSSRSKDKEGIERHFFEKEVMAVLKSSDNIKSPRHNVFSLTFFFFIIGV